MNHTAEGKPDTWDCNKFSLHNVGFIPINYCKYIKYT